MSLGSLFQRNPAETGLLLGDMSHELSHLSTPAAG